MHSNVPKGLYLIDFSVVILGIFILYGHMLFHILKKKKKIYTLSCRMTLLFMEEELDLQSFIYLSVRRRLEPSDILMFMEADSTWGAHPSMQK